MADPQSFFLHQKKEMEAFFWKHGYLHIKNVYTQKDINSFLEADKDLVDIEKDLSCYPNLSRLPSNKQLIDALSHVLKGELVYSFDSSICINTSTDEKLPPSQLLHRDNQAEFNFNTNLPVVRCGVYWQDYTNASGGLKVAIGSHKHEYISLNFTFKKLIWLFLRFSKWGCKYIYNKRIKNEIELDPTVELFPNQLNLKNLKFFPKYVNLYPRPGDLLLWNIRLLHQGYAKKIVFFPNLSLGARFESLIPWFLCAKKASPRTAAFFVLQTDDELAQEYRKKRIHALTKKHWSYQPLKSSIQTLEKNFHKIDLSGYKKNNLDEEKL